MFPSDQVPVWVFWNLKMKAQLKMTKLDTLNALKSETLKNRLDYIR